MNAAERAYADTKDRILRGDLAGGAMLSEGQVCDRLGLSRTPVHEAFLRLDAERLLSLSSRKGAVVLPMSAHEARDVLEMREAIEAASARRVVAARPPAGDLRAGLQPILDRQELAMGAADLDAFIVADDAFHTEVVHRSGNRLAAHMFDLLRDRQQRLRYQLLSISDEQLSLTLIDHNELAGCLCAHDADGYATVLARHIARHQGAL